MLFSEKIFQLSLINMTFGDPFASLLGIYFKNSRKLFGVKNIAGSFGSAFICLILSKIYLEMS